MMIRISDKVFIPERELDFQFIRAQGPGGQHVNKTSSAVQLRFDINASSLPPFYKERLLAHTDRRMSKDGVLVIKAQQHRSQDMNREEAIERLVALIQSATQVRAKRKATRPTLASKRKRMDSKTKHGKLKTMRGKVRSHD